jgi:flagellar hook-length control protein FliK
VIPMNVIPQVTKSSPNPGGIGPPDSGPLNEAMGAEFSAALKGEMKGADLPAGSGDPGSAQSDAQNLFQDAPKTGVPSQSVPKGVDLALTPVKQEAGRLVTKPAEKSDSEPGLAKDRAKATTRDESREVAAAALAQGIHPALLPQVTVLPKEAPRAQDTQDSATGSRLNQGARSVQTAAQVLSFAGDQGPLGKGMTGASGKKAGQEVADTISGHSRELLGGDFPHAESVSVDPRVRDLLSQSDLRVQEFELKQGATPTAAAALTALEKPAETMAPNRVSTEDFLSLRGIKKEKSSKGTTEGRVENPMMQAQPFGKLHLGPVLDAPVTQGSAGKPVLSHDALHQITQQVSGLSQARQDGEIKIRLKPDHLGELMMSVKTSGDKVAVQIKAQDHEAKKIIEDSIGRLKDSLSSQNLTLHKVDVVTQPSAGQGADGGFQMDFGAQSQGNFSRNDSQQYRDSSSNGRQEFLYDERPVSSNLKSINPAWARRPGGSGGLDLIA